MGIDRNSPPALPTNEKPSWRPWSSGGSTSCAQAGTNAANSSTPTRPPSLTPFQRFLIMPTLRSRSVDDREATEVLSAVGGRDVEVVESGRQQQVEPRADVELLGAATIGVLQ